MIPVLSQHRRRRPRIAGGGGGAPGFSPADVAGLVAWYDAAQLAGHADGDAVPQFDDASGNAHHATQAAAGSRAVYRAAPLNGRPALEFDGTNDFYASPFAQGLPLSMFVVGTMPAAGARAFWSGGGNYLYVYRDPPAALSVYAGANLVTSYHPATGVPFYTTVIANGASSSVRVNGATVATGNAGSNGSPPGAHLAGGGGGRALGGLIAEIVVYAGAVADADRDDVEAYLADKYTL